MQATLEQLAKISLFASLDDELPYYRIAHSIGITYEECVRLIKNLKSVLAYSRGGKITILDVKGLDAIASGIDKQP